MEKKISDVNEMIEHNRHEQVDEDDEMKGSASNRSSSPTMADKERHHNDNNNENDDDAHDENEDASEKRDNGDRCSSTNVNSSNSTRTMADELAHKEKEVSVWRLSQ